VQLIDKKKTASLDCFTMEKCKQATFMFWEQADFVEFFWNKNA